MHTEMPRLDAGRIPVLLIEDNRLLRDGLVNILNGHRDFDVSVAEGEDAVMHRLTRVPPPPRVAVVDGGLIEHDPAELVESITRTAPETRVIVMDLVSGPGEVVEFIKVGACGFIMKDATVDVFVGTIRRVAAGEDVLPSTIAGTIFSHIAKEVTRRSGSKIPRSVKLTKREREIVGLIAEGLSNKEIAQQIHLSPHTVKSHVHSILEKLALHSRLQVAAYAHRMERDAEAP